MEIRNEVHARMQQLTQHKPDNQCDLFKTRYEGLVTKYGQMKSLEEGIASCRKKAANAKTVMIAVPIILAIGAVCVGLGMPIPFLASIGWADPTVLKIVLVAATTLILGAAYVSKRDMQRADEYEKRANGVAVEIQKVGTKERINYDMKDVFVSGYLPSNTKKGTGKKARVKKAGSVFFGSKVVVQKGSQQWDPQFAVDYKQCSISSSIWIDVKRYEKSLTAEELIALMYDSSFAAAPPPTDATKDKTPAKVVEARPRVVNMTRALNTTFYKFLCAQMDQFVSLYLPGYRRTGELTASERWKEVWIFTKRSTIRLLTSFELVCEGAGTSMKYNMVVSVDLKESSAHITFSEGKTVQKNLFG